MFEWFGYIAVTCIPMFVIAVGLMLFARYIEVDLSPNHAGWAMHLIAGASSHIFLACIVVYAASGEYYKFATFAMAAICGAAKIVSMRYKATYTVDN